MKIQGFIKTIKPVEKFGNGFTKQEIHLETQGQYPQVLCVEFHKDKTNLLRSFTGGESVEISINLKGREWVNPQGEVKVFNSIIGWKIDSLI